MRLVIEVNPELYRIIVDLLDKKRFQSFNEFADVSFRNQIALEGAQIGNDGLVEMRRSQREQALVLKAPDLDLMEKSDIAVRSSTWSIEEPLWGQLNRFFPVKIVCRVLLDLQRRNDGHPTRLSELQNTAARNAVVLQRELTALDDQMSRKGTDKLSTALPSNADKSKRRFKTQFVGYLQSDGRPRGALSDLRLGVIEKSSDNSTVALTKAGFEFSILENPVLDLSRAANTLTSEERTYLVNHIRKEIPIEWRFMIGVLRSIASGHNDPEKLTKAILRDYPDWSQTMANTNRVGVLSRMDELGLIERSRSASGARYELTVSGREVSE